MKNLTSGSNLSLMSKNAGTDEGSVKSTLEMGLPLLLGGLSNNASKPEGLSAIMKSLPQTGTSSPEKDIASYLSAPASIPGSDMLSSLLGSNAQPIQQAISKSNELSTGVVGKILTMALPLVMSSLSKNLAKNAGPGDLVKLLGEHSKMAMSASPSAAGVMQELSAPARSSGGLMDRIKKLFGS